MSYILSISRRTDVPAWYGDWFMQRLAAGFAGWENPFSGRRTLVSLRRSDVQCLAFWSKNYRPFLPHLRTLKEQGWPCFLNFTITGLPTEFECHGAPVADALDCLGEVSALFSPGQVTWRYDPVVLSDRTPAAYHLSRFAELAVSLAGRVTRCVFSFPARYGKVARRFAQFERKQGLQIFDPTLAERRELAGKLAEIGAGRGIELQACCDDALLGGRVAKAHCVDGAIIARLVGGSTTTGQTRPTRKACGCAASVDIGCYDTCPTGCIYCYANTNKEQAERSHAAHDLHAVFLGHSREESELFVRDIQQQAAAKQKPRAAATRQLDLKFETS